MRQVITDDLDALLAALPARVRDAALALPDHTDLIEIVLDLGRLPTGRFPSREVILGETPVTREEIEGVVARVGQFGDDNRAGIERTLHRISALRNRRGQVVGLTCRVGRAVQGAVTLIRDVVEQGRSILILGRPGVGKTTLLREAARVLADELGKRVVVVDTSNEIAGDGDVPHPGIGRARRMQVARPSEQHQVMIEAVENHMPEVIVIDEIGTELEAQAARTIAERGVQLVGTAHGRTLDNLLINPTLSDLVGGVQAVTLGDEEARRRGTQKTVLERKAPPTFDVLVEQEERHLVGVHHDVAAAVDGLLRGESPQREMREREPNGTVRRWIERAPRAARSDGVGLPTREAPIQRDETPAQRPGRERSALAGQRSPDAWWLTGRREARADTPRYPASAPTRGAETSAGLAGRPGGVPEEGIGGRWLDPELALSAPLLQQAQQEARPATERPADGEGTAGEGNQTVPAFRKRRIYPMGVNRGRLEQAIHELGLPAVISRDERDADALLVLKSLYRRQPDRVEAAQRAGLPVYVLRSGSVERMREALADMFGATLPRSPQQEGAFEDDDEEEDVEDEDE